MRNLIILLFLGLILRLVLSVQFYQGDVNNHISWGKDILLNGTQGIYEREFYFRYGTLTPNYPPLVLFLFAGSYGLYELLHNTSVWLNTNISIFPSNIIFLFQNPNLLPAFLKLPAIFSDIGIAYFVYLFSKKWFKEEKWPLIGASLVLFNPAFFYNSALWGQVEAVPTLFVLASLYVLLFSKQTLLPAILFAVALLCKQNAVVFMPIFLLVFWKRYSVVQTVKSGLVSALFFWIIFFPFNNGNFITFPFEVYWNKILTNSVSDYVTYHAFNFWTLFVGFDLIHDSTAFYFGLNYQMWGYLLFGAVLIYGLFILWKSKLDEYLTIYITSLISFSSFLFMTRLHERHLEPTIPFLLLISIKEKKLMPIFIFVSLFYIINLYQDWWAPRINNLVDIFSNVDVIIWLVFILLGCFIYMLALFYNAFKKTTTFSRG